MVKIVGVDIGRHSLRAVELHGAEKARPVVARAHAVPLHEDSVRRGEVLDANAVAVAFRRLWSTGGFGTRDIVLGMGGPGVIARELTVPSAPLGRIREALPFQVQEHLPIPVADAVLDFYPIAEAPPANGVPMVSGLLIAAAKQAVGGNLAAAAAARLRVAEVDLVPFAITRALGREMPAATPFAIVNVGADTTSISVVANGVPQFVRIVPFGGDDITRALMSRLELGYEQAEQLKRSLGLAGSMVPPEHRPAVETIYQVTTELMSSLRNTFSYYASSVPGRGISQVIISGGASRMPGFAAAVGELVAVPATARDPFATLTMGRRAREQLLEHPDTDFTTAVGLALGSKP